MGARRQQRGARRRSWRLLGRREDPGGGGRVEGVRGVPQNHRPPPPPHSLTLSPAGTRRPSRVGRQATDAASTPRFRGGHRQGGAMPAGSPHPWEALGGPGSGEDPREWRRQQQKQQQQQQRTHFAPWGEAQPHLYPPPPRLLPATPPAWGGGCREAPGGVWPGAHQPHPRRRLMPPKTGTCPPTKELGPCPGAPATPPPPREDPGASWGLGSPQSPPPGLVRQGSPPARTRGGAWGALSLGWVGMGSQYPGAAGQWHWDPHTGPGPSLGPETPIPAPRPPPS